MRQMNEETYWIPVPPPPPARPRKRRVWVLLPVIIALLLVGVGAGYLFYQGSIQISLSLSESDILQEYCITQPQVAEGYTPWHGTETSADTESTIIVDGAKVRREVQFTHPCAHSIR